MPVFLYYLFLIIRWAVNIYTGLIVIYTLLSWIPNAYHTKFAQLLYKIVGPFLNFFERIIPPIAGLSFAPIVAILVLQFIETGLLKFLQIFI